LSDLHGPYRNIERDVLDGLTADRKQLPPKYFYDEEGSRLFEEITRLPEYYQTRTEEQLLRHIAADLARADGARSIVELGSGSSSKTRVLLDAHQEAGTLQTYVPVDVSPTILEATAGMLGADYPGLQISCLVHDFEAHLDLLPGAGPHLLVFLGGTIGNLDLAARSAFLTDVADVLAPEDCFLLGTDLIKDHGQLEAAYNDSAGVTADFNLNVLSVLNRELDADFDLVTFEHRAVYNEAEERIEMHLVSRKAQKVTIQSLGLEVSFASGESILTEISCKFTEESVRAMLSEAGLEMVGWFTDPNDWFGISLSRSQP